VEKDRSKLLDTNNTNALKNKPSSISAERITSLKTKNIKPKEKSETYLKIYIGESKGSRIKSSKFLNKPHDLSGKNYTTYLSKGAKGSGLGLSTKSSSHDNTNSTVKTTKSSKFISKKNSNYKPIKKAADGKSPFHTRSINSKLSFGESPKDSLIYISKMN
jgi:hypothetical protein